MRIKKELVVVELIVTLGGGWVCLVGDVSAEGSGGGLGLVSLLDVRFSSDTFKESEPFKGFQLPLETG